MQLAYLGDSSCGVWARFKIDQPLPHRSKILTPAPTTSQSASAAAVAINRAQIKLATHDLPLEEPAASLADGQILQYSNNQRITVRRKSNGEKYFQVEHLHAQCWRSKAGPSAWPWYQQELLVKHGPGLWILELEGEKCAMITLAGGYLASTHPGHDGSHNAKLTRYQTLLDAAIEGVVYIADNDEAGISKAERALQAAATVDLSFVWIKAADIWPNIPQGGSIDNAPGSAAQRCKNIISAIENGVERYCCEQQHSKTSNKKTNLLNIDARRILLTPDLVLKKLPAALGGSPEYDIRANQFHVGSKIYTADDVERLYLQLCDEQTNWPKSITADAFLLLAHQNNFDPVKRYLIGVEKTIEPLAKAIWQNLDQHLFGIKDPIARDFIPQFLISSVARVFRPGCKIRRTPVIVGPQGRGKTELGRTLFSSKYWVEGVHDFKKDDLMRCQSAWAVELCELDGITRRADQEALKGFLTASADDFRRPYGKGVEKFPRRFVFWGTSNAAPFRDASGSSRFVAIAIPDQFLPLQWCEQNRDAIWSRAVQEFRNIPETEQPWDRIAESERQAIAARNCDYQLQDPWEDQIEAFLSKQQQLGEWPIKQCQIFAALELPASQQNNASSSRLSNICNKLGWQQARKRKQGQRNKSQGFWPINSSVNSQSAQFTQSRARAK